MGEPSSRPDDSICVLHVDDEPDFADVAATFLEREDSQFTVKTVTSASDGLDNLADTTFDCIISDYDMPGQNGIEFLENVRDEYPDLPFILYTGKGSEEVASDAISAGVTDYLQKGGGTDQYTVLANRIRNAVEQFRSKQALAERNRELRRYKRMVKSMREAACIYNSEGRFELVNKYLAEWYNTSPEELEGDQSALIPQIREQADGNPYQELLAGERREIWGEIDGDFPGHGYAVLEYRLTPLRVDGTVEGVVSVARDITDHREQQVELKQTNAVLSTLFETLPVGIIAEDENRNALAVNERLFDLFDIPGSPDEVVGADCEQMVQQVSEIFVNPDEFVERLDELVAEREPTDYEELVLDDGRTFERSYRPIEIPRGEGHVWVYRDITDRKEREWELEAQKTNLEELTVRLEEQYRNLFEEAPVMAVVTRAEDGEPIIEECNQRFLNTLGYDRSEVIGRDLAELYTPASTEELLDQGGYNRALSGEFVREERELATADGETVETLLRAVPRRDTDDTTTTGTLAMYIDISERKQLERETERLEEFTSIVSHDLRNPLNVAEGHLELAREECNSKHLNAVATAHDRMNTLIEDLLTLAREGKAVGATEPIDLAHLIDSCWTNIATAEATLRTEIDQRIQADRSRLQQLLENLMRNAIEHGGEDVIITVGMVSDGLYIEDNGPGIPDGERDDVFEAGYSTTEAGTGFGLSIVKQVAQAHGWEVRVTDGSEGGARFEITGVTFTAA
jgi:PAS domain S-box-containing protein